MWGSDRASHALCDERSDTHTTLGASRGARQGGGYASQRTFIVSAAPGLGIFSLIMASAL